MNNEQKWLTTLQKAIRANFALARGGNSLTSVIRYEDSADSARAMYFGIITENLGVDFAKNVAFTSGSYDYDDLMYEYNKMMLSEEPSPRQGDNGKWFRYVNKKELILRYFKYGKK